MPRKPDYKREKKLREEAQRRHNQEAQQRKAARKTTANDGETAVTEATPEPPR